MQLSPSTKLGLVAFLAMDVLLAVVFVSLYLRRAEMDRIAELRDIGTSIYPTTVAVQEFELLDQSGARFGNEQLLGRWSLVFFGFTSCPDICPLTLTELVQFQRRLREQGIGEQPLIALVSVDPEHDSPAVMAAYLDSFEGPITGLTGEPETIARLAEQFYVGVSQASGHGGHEPEVASGDENLIEHSAHISVIDPRGQLYAVMRAPHRDRDLLRAYLSLIGEE